MTGRISVEPLHPTPEDFAGFLRDPPGPSHAKRNSLIVRHLLTGCSICRKRLQDLKQAAPTLSRILEIPTSGKAQDSEKPASRYKYDWAFARVERTMSTLLARGRLPERLPETLAELATLPESEQIRRVATGDFAEPDVILHLLDRSYAIRYENPRKMLHLTLLARTAADACPADSAGGERELADLRADAWGQFANALRINAQLGEAELALKTAFLFFETGNSPSKLRALLLSQSSAIRYLQGHFASAVELIEQAGQIYRELGQQHLLGRSMVQKAICILRAGQPTEAIRILDEAILLIDREEDPRLFLAAHHNQGCCYIDLGRPEEALALYYEARDLYRDHSDSLILLRAAWQEGQLLREIGHLHNAELALLRTRQGFLEAGLAYEAAMVSLDLAEVYKKAGLSDKLRRTVAEALPVFKALRASRETLASLLRLQDAAEPDEPAQQASDPSI